MKIMETLEKISPAEILKHKPEDCPFCKSNETEKPDPIPKSKIIQNPDEDPDKQLIGNKSGELDSNMADVGDPRPQDWLIDLRNVGIDDSEHKVTANPHHLIPGNESLKEAPTLLPWIFADKGKIDNDIGYNVNNSKNGIWLPSNNSMRGNSHWSSDEFKTDFVVAAMNEAGGHFHDTHPDYSDSVTKILNKIADRMNGIDQKAFCFEKEEPSSGKFKPPYALVQRLNGVSERILPYLKAEAKPQASFYTSRLVLKYWKKKGKM